MQQLLPAWMWRPSFTTAWPSRTTSAPICPSPSMGWKPSLARSTDDLAALHPGAFQQTMPPASMKTRWGPVTSGAGGLAPEQRGLHRCTCAQQQFARGQVLDFGGGIGTHALAAAAAVCRPRLVVDLNPQPGVCCRPRQSPWPGGPCRCIGILKAVRASVSTRWCASTCWSISPIHSDQLEHFHAAMAPGLRSTELVRFKGHNGEYPFHFDDPVLVDAFSAPCRPVSSRCFTPS